VGNSHRIEMSISFKLGCFQFSKCLLVICSLGLIQASQSIFADSVQFITSSCILHGHMAGISIAGSFASGYIITADGLPSPVWSVIFFIAHCCLRFACCRRWALCWRKQWPIALLCLPRLLILTAPYAP
jgi:hypothetical protein